MPGVNVPSSPNDPLKTVVPMAGSIVGGMYGGPGGAIAGRKIGTALVQGGPDPSAVQTSPIDRRIGTLEDDPSSQLAQADAALKQLPPEYQEAYGATIAKARQMDAQGGP